MVLFNQTLARVWIRAKSVNLCKISWQWLLPLTIGWYTHTLLYRVQAWIPGGAIFASYLLMLLRPTTF